MSNAATAIDHTPITRTQARQIANKLVKTGQFTKVTIVEDLTHRSFSVVAINAFYRTRIVASIYDWELLQAWELSGVER